MLELAAHPHQPGGQDEPKIPASGSVDSFVSFLPQVSPAKKYIAPPRKFLNRLFELRKQTDINFSSIDDCDFSVPSHRLYTDPDVVAAGSKPDIHRRCRSLEGFSFPLSPFSDSWRYVSNLKQEEGLLVSGGKEKKLFFCVACFMIG